MIKDPRQVLEASLTALPTEQEAVEAAMAWHFSGKTGSKFWLSRAGSLGFDPLTEIHQVSDLTRFPDVSGEWREIAADDLVPCGMGVSPDVPFVFESGGTTGAPKRIVEVGREPNAKWVDWMLDQHDFPREGHWLYIGPTGPHRVGHGMRVFGHVRGAMFFTVDMDPRWVKTCIREGRIDDARRYVRHLLDQAHPILRSQRITTLVTTPPVLEAMASVPPLAELVQSKVKAILWAGASMSSETRHLLSEEIFPDTTLVGLYGNTLMGGAVQRPHVADDEDDAVDCVFTSFHPYVHLSVVDADGRDVAYGERGRVRFHCLSRDVFLPNVIERGTALRIAPVTGFRGDAVADVQPAPAADAGSPVIEGVY